MTALVHNVRDPVYGALGDAVTDDTTAIQRAINDCAAVGGGHVWFPRGTYIVSATLTLPSFVNLHGVGTPDRAGEYSIDPTSVASIIKCSAASSFDVMANADSTNGNAMIGIRGLRFDCSGMTGDKAALVFDKVRRSFVTDCYFRGAATTSRILFRYAGSSEHNAITFSRFEGGGISLASTTTGNRLVIDTCEIGAGGITLNDGYDHIIRNCDIYNDGITAPFPWVNGITLAHTTGALVEGNQVARCLNDGIALNTDCLGTVVIGNQCKENSTQTAGTWGGILINSNTAAAPSSENLVIGNRCWDINGAAGNQGYGVRLASTGGASLTANNLIEGNLLSGNRTAGVQIGASLGTNTVRNNMGWNPQGNSVTQPAVAASTVAVTNTTQSDCTVYIAGGTVTVIKIGGVATGLGATPATVRVPSGQTIALTYTVAPTWQWFGD